MADSSDRRLMALRQLCGMRRYVRIETNSLGTTISAQGVGCEYETFGAGSGLVEAIDDLMARYPAAVPQPEHPTESTPI